MNTEKDFTPDRQRDEPLSIWAGNSPTSTLHFFETRVNGLLRTTGLLLIHRSVRASDEIPTGQAKLLGRMAQQRPDATAHGKVAILRGRRLSVYQAGPDGGLVRALCGNATAAAIHAHGSASGQLELVGPENVGITAEFHRSGDSVSQVWRIPDIIVTEFEWNRRRCAHMSGLNRYVLVFDGLPDGIDAETCRRQLSAGHANTKLAVFGDDAAPNHVSFFNATGRHGAAPMTGLASLAVAAEALPHLAACIDGRGITYQTASGREICRLPDVSRGKDGRLRIGMPDVDAFVAPPMSEVLQ
ncbi:hypothetical protein J2857_002858 [Neorhizobium galegae]|uniref:hypothetical protein n=1 Tax=Neorhizobium galegae TaxID=399 RepID=UPI001AE8B206|nr:hypothetical protein [Neorhizobium galegae]MBP2560089.1 hypothetical protein [Neorhizobium galegae]